MCHTGKFDFSVEPLGSLQKSPRHTKVMSGVASDNERSLGRQGVSQAPESRSSTNFDRHLSSSSLEDKVLVQEEF